MKQNQRKIPIKLEDVERAYKEMKKKGKSPGVDKETWQEFDKNLEKNLYVIWNRLSSGSYHPPHIKGIKIPKSNGE